jgi:hypothetical protein
MTGKKFIFLLARGVAYLSIHRNWFLRVGYVCPGNKEAGNTSRREKFLN